MATREQIEANRKNAKRSTGPKSTDRTRFNGLKHGLRAEQVVLPGEDPAAFEAERQAWFDDWRPKSHTRAVLCERAAVASWKLTRATRVEAARLYDIAADVAHEFDLSQKELIEVALHMLPRNPAEAVSRLRSEAAGLERLVAFWDELAAAVDTSWRPDHHDRLLQLLGHLDGPNVDLPEAGRASLSLLAGGPDASAAAGAIRTLCVERSTGYLRERSQYWDLTAYRQHLIDAAIAPTTKEAQLLHRYEVAHEATLRATLRGLLALERSGSDLPEPAPDVPAAPAEPAATEDVPEKPVSNPNGETACGKLASIVEPAPAGDGSTPAASPPSGPGRPPGSEPGPPQAWVVR